MRQKLLSVAAFIASLAVSAEGGAAVVHFAFAGAGFVAEGFLTISPNMAPADPDPGCGTVGHNACRTDPASAYAITAISGTFTDSADGITNDTITGLVPINPANERDPMFDPRVPSSLSFIDYPGPPAGALTYDNLFYPAGAPVVCDFPFTGTRLDPFGMAFTVNGGYTVDVWGDGDMNGPGTASYGIGVTDGTNALTYADGTVAAIPEPSSWVIMLVGFGASGAVTRARRKPFAPAV